MASLHETDEGLQAAGVTDRRTMQELMTTPRKSFWEMDA
jgi:hypothetical protein